MPFYGRGQFNYPQHPSLQNQPTSNKTRQLDQRLIAKVTEDSVLIDSTVYTYSGMRGSYFTNNIYRKLSRIDFDNRYHYRPDSGIVKLSGAYHRTYNSNNLITSELDSVYYQNVWLKNRRLRFSYDTNSRLSEEFIDTYNSMLLSWDKYWKTVYAYPSNTQISLYSFIWNLSQWDTVSRIERVYQNGDLSQEVSSYKQNGIWINNDKDEFVYSNGMLSEWMNYNWTNTVWDTVARRRYVFDSFLRLDSLIYEGKPFGIQWVRYFDYHWQWVGNNATTIYHNDYGNSTSYKVLRTYNTNGYPLTETALVQNGVNYSYDPGKGSTKKRYYYETYNNNVSTQDHVRQSSGLRIYPNPVQKTLNLDLEKNRIQQVQILDMNGRLFLQQAGEQQKLDVSNLIPGSYLIRVIDNKGNEFSSTFQKIH